MESLIAIVAAFHAEIKPLINRLEGVTIHRRHGFSFLQGYINKKRVLLAISGMGRNNALTMTKTLVNHFPLSLIISTGTSGALQPHLQAGDIIVADRLFLAEPAQEKSSTISMTAHKIRSVYKVQKALIELSLKVLESSTFRYNIGPLITVDNVIGNIEAKRKLGENLNCLAVEMESAAIAQVAKEKRLPFLAIRSISDSLMDNIEKAIQLYDNIKEDTSLFKRFIMMLRYPRESLELMKLRKNCSKAAASLEKFFLQFLAKVSIIE